jgi:hypothetical protein
MKPSIGEILCYSPSSVSIAVAFLITLCHLGFCVPRCILPKVFPAFLAHISQVPNFVFLEP